MMFFSFLENMALIIALMYLALKVREHWPDMILISKREYWLNGLFIGFLVFSIMYNPMPYEGMRLDLREAPLYFIAFVGGWKSGAVAAFIPIIYRFYLEGPTVTIGIVQSILLPVLIGTIFHDKENYRPPLSILNIKRMMIGFLAFEVIKSVWMAAVTPATLSIAVVMSVLASIAVLALGLMLNDAHRHIIEHRALHHQSTHDPLTGLPNIRFFKTLVQELMERNVPFAIAMVDVDHFKAFNDTHGHPKGDAVLKAVGALLKKSAGPKTLTARYGGEEFIVCCTEVTEPGQAGAWMEKMRAEIEHYPFEGEETQPDGQLTVSIGFSFFDGTKPLDRVIEEADQALYRSKANGRNQTTAFTDSHEKTAGPEIL